MNPSGTDRRAIETPSSIDIEPRGASPVWHVVTLGNGLTRRIAVIAWLAVAIGVGFFFGWSWVVAAGLSSLVLGLLPCLAMCALGFCASSSGKKCSDQNVPRVPPHSGG